jgi:hypothetical protein
MVLITLSVAELRWQVKQCRTFAGMIEITNIEALGLKPVRIYISARKFPHILASDWTLASAVRVSQLTGWPMTWTIPAFTYLRFVCRCKSPKLIYNIRELYSPHEKTAPNKSGPPHCRGFTITLRYSTFLKTPLDEWSAQRRDLYATKHNSHKRKTFMPPARFKPEIPESERPQTHTLDRAATGIGMKAIRLYLLLKVRK